MLDRSHGFCQDKPVQGPSTPVLRVVYNIAVLVTIRQIVGSGHMNAALTEASFSSIFSLTKLWQTTHWIREAQESLSKITILHRAIGLRINIRM